MKTNMCSRVVAAIALSTALASIAQAKDDVSSYVALGGTRSTISSDAFGETLDADITSATLLFGFNFTQNVALEFEINVGVDGTTYEVTVPTGPSTQTTLETEITVPYEGNLMLVGRLPLSGFFNLFARAGYGYGQLKLSSPLPQYIADFKDSGGGLAFGAGAEIFFGNDAQIGLRAQFTQYQLNVDTGGLIDDTIPSYGLQLVGRF